MRHLLVSAAFLGSLGTFGCFAPDPGRWDGPPDGEPPAVRLRVRNATDMDFDSVTVAFPGQTERFGPLASGQTSPYREVIGAYRYAYVEARHGAALYVLQPIDYVGEAYLRHGTYTYDLVAHRGQETAAGVGGTVYGVIEIKLRVDERGHRAPADGTTTR